MDDGEPTIVSPLIYRAAAMRACRVHELRMATGTADEEESIESEVGALLVADTEHEIRNMAEMMRGYLDATNAASSKTGSE